MKTLNQAILESLYSSCKTEWKNSLTDEEVTIAGTDLPKSKFTNAKVLPLLLSHHPKKGTDPVKLLKEPVCLFPTEPPSLSDPFSKDGEITKLLSMFMCSQIDKGVCLHPKPNILYLSIRLE
jgi:hypothetical protein